MTKVLFLLLLLLVYYISAMYESPALMVLFLVQLFLIVIMFILSVYFKRSLTVSFAEKIVWTEMGRPFSYQFHVENRGRLPVSRLTVKFRIEQPGKKSAKKAKLCGNGQCGESFLSGSAVLEHCGISAFRAYRLRVFDYLSLFSRRKKLDSAMEAVVFPRPYKMRIETGGMSSDREILRQQTAFIPGTDYGEIRQIREYRDGDSVRHIHWNQTARSEQIWVKEYAEETESKVSLFLDLTAEQRSPDDRDAFCALLYGLLSGILPGVSSVQVFWQDRKNGGLVEMEVRDEEQCRELFLRFYRTGELFERGGGEASEFSLPAKDAMRLTGDLRWFVGDRLLFHFSKENLEPEMTGQIFSV